MLWGDGLGFRAGFLRATRVRGRFDVPTECSLEVPVLVGESSNTRDELTGRLRSIYSHFPVTNHEGFGG